MCVGGGHIYERHMLHCRLVGKLYAIYSLLLPKHPLISWGECQNKFGSEVPNGLPFHMMGAAHSSRSSKKKTFILAERRAHTHNLVQ